MKFNRAFLMGVLLAAAVLVSSCAAPASQSAATQPVANSGADTVIRVGSKDFTEEFIVAEMYAALLEQAGLKVERRLNLGGTTIAQTAILNGEIDLYPEYTSTGLLTVLKLEPLQDPQEIIAKVRSEYESQFKLTWLDPSPFNNTQALAMTQAKAAELGIATFSDLSTQASNLILGGPAEFLEREDGLKALQSTYGGFQFKEVKQLGTGSLRYQALQDGQIDVVVAFGTDGQIQGLNLTRLEDDKGLYPVYQIAPVVRQDTLEKAPEIREALNALAPLLTDEVMSGLNWQVDGPDKKEPADVARAFLQEKGLLK